MHQIIDLDDLPGKTIKRAERLDYDTLGIAFDDGSYFRVEVADGLALQFSEEARPLELAKLGLIAEGDVRRLMEERQAREEAERREGLRQQYERLRAIFEPEGKGAMS